jgi:molecular chaperone HtpG
MFLNGTAVEGGRQIPEALVRMAKRVSENGSVEEVVEAAWLLLDQARIVGGEPLPDPAAFSKRLSDVMRRALAA